MLEKLNSFREADSVMVHESVAGFSYSDGSDVELYLKNVLETAEDLGSCSVELEAAIHDWPTEYHLSSQRANLVRGLSLPSRGRVLEVGCGCGAITRYLGEQDYEVDAIEGSPKRAELARLRCRGLDQVSIYCANFNALTLPEGHYDMAFVVGVAEYAPRFLGEHNSDSLAVVAFLDRIRRAVKPGGLIIIAIENRVGLKYMMGAHEDHYARRLIGIHDYFGYQDINTYTLNEWQDIFDQTGLSSCATYLPFPDYKLPRVLLGDEFARKNPYSFCHLDGIRSRDYIEPFNPPVRESFLWQAVAAGGAVDRFANSFLFIVSPEPRETDPLPLYDFIHLPDFGRRREYCLIARKEQGTDIVRRHRVTEREPEPGKVMQRVLDEPYQPGILLSVEWSRALELEPDGIRFIELVSNYVSFLQQRDELSIDLTPSNIIVDREGNYHPFDEEWQVEWPIGVDYLLFRALLVFVTKSVEAIQAFSEERCLRTIEDFIAYVAAQAGVELGDIENEYLALEEQFQSSVAAGCRKKGTRYVLQRELRNATENMEPAQARVYWKLAGESYSEANSRMQYVDPTGEEQTICFRLPPEANRATHIQLHPCDEKRDPGVGFMQIQGIRVRGSAHGSSTGELLWAMPSADIISRYATMSGIRFGESGLGSVFMVTNDDPWLEFPFIPRCRLPDDRYLEVEVDLIMPHSAEYWLARDQYLQEADRLAETKRHMDMALNTYRHMEKELTDIKSSAVWTVFTRYVQARARLSGFSAKLLRWRENIRVLGFRRAIDKLQQVARNRILGVLNRDGKEVLPPTRYELWREQYVEIDRDPVKNGPLISVLMPVYNVDAEVLDQAVSSVRRQTYGNWELCIADDASTRPDTRRYLSRLKDPRIKVRFLETNLNISGATNAAAELAQGEYLAFMDNDDELSADALNVVAREVVEGAPDLLYTDEDFIRPDGHLDNPHLKCDYNPDLLLSHNYITHLLVLARPLFDAVGGLRSEFDGAQDYDLILRAVEQANEVRHIPKPVYHWRMLEQSTSVNPLAKQGGHERARLALEDALKRRRIEGTVEDLALPHFFRVRRALQGSPPITIIVPFRDKPELLRLCVESILNATSYGNYRILGISNSSMDSRTHCEMKRLAELDERVAFKELNTRFNFSRLVNFGAEHADGQHLVLLNNDIEIITPDWLEGLLEHSQRDEVAAVGAKLYYPNNRIQHAGLGVGLGGYAGHLHKNFRADSPGYFNRLRVTQNVSAVTGALMMVRKSVFTELNGFDEERFSVAYNDVDFCLRARERGYLNVFTPFVEAYHHESVSRGYEDTEDKQARFEREAANLKQRHGDVLKRGDPYYNPNFDQGRDDFALPAVESVTRQ